MPGVTGGGGALVDISLQKTVKTATRVEGRTEPDLDLIKQVEQVTTSDLEGPAWRFVGIPSVRDPSKRDIRYPLGFRHQAKSGSPDQEAVHRTEVGVSRPVTEASICRSDAGAPTMIWKNPPSPEPSFDWQGSH